MPILWAALYWLVCSSHLYQSYGTTYFEGDFINCEFNIIIFFSSEIFPKLLLIYNAEMCGFICQENDFKLYTISTSFPIRLGFLFDVFQQI